jgi:hypothetical protein
VSAAIQDRLPIDDALDSVDRGDTPVRNVGDAAAGAIWALAHILGCDPEGVHKLIVDPDAGMITAEVWTGQTEPAPWGPPGSRRPTVEVRRWSYRTPAAIALDLVTRSADSASY